MKSKNPVFIEITPQLASEWIENNMVGNRKINQDRVRLFADQMKRGLWLKTGNAIQFDTDGMLQDGQHRLLACIESGVSFISLVVFDIPKESYLVQNGSKPSTAADVLRFNGVRNPNRASSAITGLIKFRKGAKGNAGADIYKITKQDVLEEYNRNQTMIDTIVADSMRYSSRTKILTENEISTTSLFLIVEKGYGYESIRTFFEKLTDFKDVSDETVTAVRLFFIKLLERQVNKERTKASYVYRRKALAYGLYKYLQGKSIKCYKGFSANPELDIWDIPAKGKLFNESL